MTPKTAKTTARAFLLAFLALAVVQPIVLAGTVRHSNGEITITGGDAAGERIKSVDFKVDCSCVGKGSEWSVTVKEGREWNCGSCNDSIARGITCSVDTGSSDYATQSNPVKLDLTSSGNGECGDGTDDARFKEDDDEVVVDDQSDIPTVYELRTSNVPALSTWGAIAIVVLVIGAGVFLILRRL